MVLASCSRFETSLVRQFASRIGYLLDPAINRLHTNDLERSRHHFPFNSSEVESSNSNL